MANQARPGSLVDRGAIGGLVGSDVRVLRTSSRKCTVAGIDNYEISGLVLVAALVQTNHGMVNLIMNAYAYYMAEVIVCIPQGKLTSIITPDNLHLDLVSCFQSPQ